MHRLLARLYTRGFLLIFLPYSFLNFFSIFWLLNCLSIFPRFPASSFDFIPTSSWLHRDFPSTSPGLSLQFLLPARGFPSILVQSLNQPLPTYPPPLFSTRSSAVDYSLLYGFHHLRDIRIISTYKLLAVIQMTIP